VLPQAPQLLRSVAKSTQNVPHFACPGGQGSSDSPQPIPQNAHPHMTQPAIQPVFIERLLRDPIVQA
jgi:hypothetical protein